MIRLKEIREKAKMKQSEVAAKLGVAQSTYSGWENETREMNYDTLINVAKLFDVSVDFLLGRTIKKKDAGSRNIPIYGDVGLLRKKYVAEIIGYEPISYRLARQGEYFGLKATDNSFWPQIQTNDIMLVRKQRKCKSGDIVVLCLNNEYCTVKRIFINKTNVVLCEDNSNEAPVIFFRKDIIDHKMKIIGKIIEIKRKVT